MVTSGVASVPSLASGSRARVPRGAAMGRVAARADVGSLPLSGPRASSGWAPAARRGGCATSLTLARAAAGATPGDAPSSAGASEALKGTPQQAQQETAVPGEVRKTSLLVVGATGTLGRQVVRRALDEGYDVRCLVRTRAGSEFLREWGATCVRGDLTNPATIPAVLVGVHTVIDCSTSRPEEPIMKVDWEGKVALIQCCEAMGIQKYVFFSIKGCEKYPEVPLMDVKRKTEMFLEESGVPFTIFRLCGFMQALISQYAAPILEEKSVVGAEKDDTRIAYMDAQDIARLTVASLGREEVAGKTVVLAGRRAYSNKEVIALCERLSGRDAKVSKSSVGLLRFARAFTNFFQWSKDAADRLAFSEVVAGNEVFSAPMEETYKMLGVDESETQTLDSYLQEYYSRILKKLKEMKATTGRENQL